MKQKVLVLGGNGFIGKNLKTMLNTQYDVIDFNRDTHTLEEIVSKSSIDIVINCSASKANASILESFEANIKFQMECIELFLKYQNIPIKWIQVGSYFELQIPFGRKDNYSLDKRICRTILYRLELERIIGLTTIFLPHIFGIGENTNRIIPYLTSNLGNGLITEISRGEQFLPILGVEDCCLAIIAAIPTDQLDCSAEPIWYDRVNLLAQIMETAISKGRIEINHEKESVDNDFPRVEFPQRVKNWSPLLTFEGFISQLVSSGTKIEE